MTGQPRFNCDQQEQPSWHDRARLAAGMLQLIPVPADRPLVVRDIGCGDLKLLAALRSNGLAAEYHGLDLHPQQPGVRAYDVRTDALAQPCDAAVLLGVIEYLEEPAAILRRLAGETRYLVASHVVRDYSRYEIEELARLNWKSHMTRHDFRAMLVDCGYHLIREEMTSNRRTVVWLCAAPAR